MNYSYDRRTATEQGEKAIQHSPTMQAFAQGKLGIYWPDITAGAVRAINDSGGRVGRDNVIQLGRGGALMHSTSGAARVLLPTGHTLHMGAYEVFVR